MMFGNKRGFFGKLPNVAFDLMVVGKVVSVGLLAIRVPFGGEHASAANAFKSHSQPADSGEQINEGEPAWCSGNALGGGLLQQPQRRTGGFACARLIPEPRRSR